MSHGSTTLVPHSKISEDILNLSGLCTSGFEALLESGQLSGVEEHLERRSWCDARGRFLIWAATSHAQRGGTKGLDFRLRNSDHLKFLVLELLGDVRDALQGANNLHQSVSDTQGGTILSNNDEVSTVTSSDTSEPDSLSDDGTSGLRELRERVERRIDGLLQLSLATQMPSTLDRFTLARLSTSLPEHEYPEVSERSCQTVRSLFPGISFELELNLSDSLALRQCSLMRGPSSVKYDSSPITNPHLLGLGPQLEPGTPPDGCRPSLSKPWMRQRPRHDISSEVEGTIFDSRRAVWIPLPLGLLQNKPYPCPSCSYVVDIRDVEEYSNHILDDLAPYQCTQVECPHSNRMIEDRSAWLRHMTLRHWQGWPDHGLEPCVLCGRSLAVKEHMGEHVAQHLEELALSVLLPAEPVQQSSSQHDPEAMDIETSSIRPFWDPTTTPFASVDEQDKGKVVIREPVHPRRQDQTHAWPSSSTSVGIANTHVTRGSGRYAKSHLWYDKAVYDADESEYLTQYTPPEPGRILYENAHSPPTSSNYNEYFLPGDRIDREVLQVDICKYLGPDAVCKPSTHHDGQRGFIIRATRPFSARQLSDLQEDSVKHRRQKEVFARQVYEQVQKTEAQSSHGI